MIVTIDLRWLLLTPTIDWFELAWETMFLVALCSALYNVRDAHRYLLASWLPEADEDARALANKDYRAAWFGTVKATLGLVLGIPSLLTPSLGLASLELGQVAYVIGLRLAFIGIGALIAATAWNDTLFRHRLAARRWARRYRITNPS